MDEINFYPRSPCGERRVNGDGPRRSETFLSTLSLRRATARILQSQTWPGISIHALLAESDPRRAKAKEGAIGISIHALLAESDHIYTHPVSIASDFYPRSPCGERPKHS